MTENNILLRALEPADIDLLYRWENNKEVWNISGTTTPFSRYALRKYIENSFLDIYQTGQLRLMICLEERAVGTIDIFDFDNHNSRAGVGIIIYNKSDRGKGLARRALELLEDYCFSTLALHQIYCTISCNNKASLELFTSQGFEEIGIKRDWVRIDGVFHNQVMLQKIRG